MLINHPIAKELTLDELQNDVETARTKFHYNDFCFTYLTVQCLIDKIRDLEFDVQLEKEKNEKLSKENDTYSKVSKIHLKSIHSLQNVLNSKS